MTFVLVAIGAAVAVSVELLEALAIVLAVAVTRLGRDALIGAAAAVAVCAVLAVVLGPVLLESVSMDALRVTIGVLLLLFGLEWLRKGTLRLAGRRSRASSCEGILASWRRSSIERFRGYRPPKSFLNQMCCGRRGRRQSQFRLSGR